MRVLVVEDEKLARERVVRLLGALGIQDVVALGTAEQALERLEEDAFDLVLLDIRMPGMHGDELAELVEGPQIVFLTAHADHAVQAFAQGATDYLLKPVDKRRLAAALERVRERAAGGAAEHGASATDSVVPSPAGKLALPSPRGMVLVPIDSLTACVIEGEGVVLRGERTYFTELRLADLERRLPTRFLRVHRRALVNLDHLERLEDLASGGYLAHLSDGTTVEVSRAAARRLRDAFLRS